MAQCTRFSEYKIMWVMVFFDLPTETKKHRRNAARFRKHLIEEGFTMFQYSIYVRHCSSRENADTHQKRVQRLIPDEGKVCMMTITDRQFDEIKIFEGSAKVQPLPTAIQLELF